MIDHLHPIVIHQDANPMFGTLLEATIPGEGGPRRFLRARCGTGRDVVIPVAIECQTARGAGAWSYGLTEAEYDPEVRT